MSDDSKIRQLEENIAKLRAEYASSWALHTKDDFQLSFVREIKSDLQSTISKWAIGAVVLLLGAGAFLINASVSQTFSNENERLVKDFDRKYQEEVTQSKDDFEWRRFHDYAKGYVYLAELYFDSPVADAKKQEKITFHLNKAEAYFLRALQHGRMHASTYWELGELSFTYANRLQVPARLDAMNAISRYEQAATCYTPVEVDKGWRGEVYLAIAKVYLSLTESKKPDDKNLALAMKFLEKAEGDYANLKDQGVPENQKNMEEVRVLLAPLRQIRQPL